MFSLINIVFIVLLSFSESLARVATQPAHDVSGTAPEGPLMVLTSGTSRGPSGDSQGTNTKIDNLMKKIAFLDSVVLVLYVCS